MSYFVPDSLLPQNTPSSISSRLYVVPLWDSLIHSVCRLGWSSLTREFSVRGLSENVFGDDKVTTDDCIVYVGNSQELTSFLSWADNSHIRVLVLPEISSVKDFAALRPGLLAIQQDEKFLVPGGRFNEMYGWDSFFIACGLLASITSDPGCDALVVFDTVLSILRHLVYQINTFGKIHNANRSYFVNRSNPPFLTSLILEIEQTADSDARFVFPASTKSKAVIAAAKEIEEYWLHPSKTDTYTGLTRYGNPSSAALCLAVEAGHYDAIFESVAIKRGLGVRELVERVRRGDWPHEDREIWRIVENDLAVRESGHDTSERLVERASDLCTADLNCLIYKSMADLFILTGDVKWREMSERRKFLSNKFLYDASLGYFCDYDSNHKARVPFVSPAGIVYPLWSGITDSHLTRRKLRDSLVIFLEQKGGIVGSEFIGDRLVPRQWDWPFGWAPHQILAWEGLRKSGFEEDSRRICYRWASLLTKYFSVFHCVPEKLDVVNDFANWLRGEDVEYGTQCSSPGEFFGWTCASLTIASGKRYLTADDIISLNAPVADSVDQELQIISKLRESGMFGEAMTWSTIASRRSIGDKLDAGDLFP